MSNAIDLVYSNMILLVTFFIIYSLLYTIDNNNFKNANDYIDIFYFTTTTQSSVGYGDITPTSRIAKMCVSTHHVLLLFIISQFVYNISGHK